jgi:hypothetical protein
MEFIPLPKIEVHWKYGELVLMISLPDEKLEFGSQLF